MRTTTRNAVVVVSAAALVGLTATAQASAPPMSTSAATTVTAADLEAGLADDLRFSREEERLARDLYAALAEVHDGAPPMSRITNSEQQHFDRVGALLEQYELDDPAKGLTAGDYAFDELDTLYADWFAEGSASLEASYQVGIELEERDIADLEAIIEDTEQADVRAVLTRLLAASKHHLAAFTAAAEGTLPGEPGQGRQNGPGAWSGPGKQNRGQGQGQGPGQGQEQRRGPAPSGPMGPGRTQSEHDCPFAEDGDDTSS